MASNDDVFFLQTQNFAVPLGGTLQTGVTGGVGVNTMVFKHISGGTLFIRGWTGQAVTTGYITQAGEVLNFGGPAQFWLSAEGATAVVGIIRGKTSGNPTEA